MTVTRSSGEMKFDTSSYMLKPVYFAFVNTMLELFLQTTYFVKFRTHSPRPTGKIVAMIALRRAILMKADPAVSLHAHRLFSGRACSCKKDPCLAQLVFLMVIHWIVIYPMDNPITFEEPGTEV